MYIYQPKHSYSPVHRDISLCVYQQSQCRSQLQQKKTRRKGKNISVQTMEVRSGTRHVPYHIKQIIASYIYVHSPSSHVPRPLLHAHTTYVLVSDATDKRHYTLKSQESFNKQSHPPIATPTAYLHSMFQLPRHPLSLLQWTSVSHLKP